jgi:hypothetical protein
VDQETLVINRIDEARKLLDSLSEEQPLVVSDAFWMDSLEDDKWTLYIASPKIEEIGITGGYSALILTLKAHPEIQLDVDDILPRSTDDPTVVEVLNAIRRCSAIEAFQLGGVFLKGHFVQRAYIYPVRVDGQTWPGGRGDS